MPEKPEVQPVDPDQEHLRLLYVLGEALDELYRVDTILLRHQKFVAAAGVNSSSGSAVDTLVGFLGEHRATFLNSSDAVADFLRGRAINEGQTLGLLAVSYAR